MFKCVLSHLKKGKMQCFVFGLMFLLLLLGSDDTNEEYSSYEEWLDSDCDAKGGKPFSVGHTFDSHTDKVTFSIGSYLGTSEQCVTIIGKYHLGRVYMSK